MNRISRRVPQASHEAPGSESSSGPASTEATSGRIYRPQSVPESVKRRLAMQGDPLKLRPSNAASGVAQRATSTGQEHSSVAGPPVAAELTGESFRRYPRAGASPTLPGRSGLEGSSTDKRSRRSVLELRHRAVPRGTRPVLGQLFRLPKPHTPTANLRAAGEGTAVTRGPYDSPVTLYLAKRSQIVPQASGSGSLSGQGSSLSESRASDSYSRIGITT